MCGVPCKTLVNLFRKGIDERIAVAHTRDMNNTAAAQIAIHMIRSAKMPAIFGGDALGEHINTIATREGWDFAETMAVVAQARQMAGVVSR